MVDDLLLLRMLIALFATTLLSFALRAVDSACDLWLLAELRENFLSFTTSFNMLSVVIGDWNPCCPDDLYMLDISTSAEGAGDTVGEYVFATVSMAISIILKLK